MNSQLNDFESLAAITQKMRTAASRSEWDALIALESQYHRHVASMKPVDEMPDETSRLRMVQLLKKILTDETEIRSHTKTWMGQLKSIMQSNQQSQLLNKAYGGR